MHIVNFQSTKIQVNKHILYPVTLFLMLEQHDDRVVISVQGGGDFFQAAF
jgi:hypothetical protein